MHLFQPPLLKVAKANNNKFWGETIDADDTVEADFLNTRAFLFEWVSPGHGKKFTIRWHSRLLIAVGRSWEANPGTPRDLSFKEEEKRDAAGWKIPPI